MLLIDANVFLAFDNIDDVHHQRALNLLAEIESGKYGDYFITDYVFNEVIGVTFRKLGQEKACKLGNNILQSTLLFNIDEHLLAEAWKVFTKTELALSLVDCTNVVAMDLVNTISIATFDQEFKKIKELNVIE